jgi:secreted trypsin-like serine protease
MRIALLAGLLSLALVPAAASAAPPQARSSIVGGQPADIADWPSIAFLLAAWDVNGDDVVDTGTQCTGTVIAREWIVSAAHCAFQPDGEPVDAILSITGVADHSDPNREAIPADRIAVHPGWDPFTLMGDVVLIHLASPSSRPALPLAVNAGQYVTLAPAPNAAGWGATDEDASTVPPNALQEAFLALQKDEECAKWAPDFDPASQTCAGTQNAAGACKGDSGGPLVVFDAATHAPVLWGLTSYGPQVMHGKKVCARDVPAIFSWIPAYATWMTDTVNQTSQGQPPPPQAGPVIEPPRDTVRPVLRRARLSTSRLRRGRRATLSFRLTEAAAVTATILKRRDGRFVPLRPSLPMAADAGTTARRFGTWLGSRRLGPGRYRIRLAPVDTAGNSGSPVTVSFRVVD